MAELGKAFVTIGAKMKPLEKAFSKTRTMVTQWAGGIQRRLGAVFSGIVRKAKWMALGVAAAFVMIAKKTAEIGMAAQETENLFRVSMKKMTAEAEAWANKYAKIIRRSPVVIKEMLGTFNLMTKSMGMSDRAALDMSKQLTRLVQGFSSLDNIRPEDAFLKIQAGLSGEIEPLKRHGIIVKEETVKAYALAQGWIKQGEKLTELMKLYARFNIIMEQMADRQNDEIRTRDDATNQMRSLKDAWGDLLRKIYKTNIEGEGFNRLLEGFRTLLENLTENLPTFSEAIQKAFTKAGDFIANFDTHLQIAYIQTTTWAQNMVDVFTWMTTQMKSKLERGFSGFRNWGRALVAWSKEKEVTFSGKQLKRQKTAKGKEYWGRRHAAAKTDYETYMNTSAAIMNEQWDKNKPAESFEKMAQRVAGRTFDAKEKIENLRKAAEPSGVARSGWDSPEDELSPFTPLEKPEGAVAGKDKKKKGLRVEITSPRFASATGGLGIESFQTRSNLGKIRGQGGFNMGLSITDPEKQQVKELQKAGRFLEDIDRLLLEYLQRQDQIGSVAVY